MQSRSLQMFSRNLLRLKCPSCIQLRRMQLSMQIHHQGQRWHAQYNTCGPLNIDNELFSIMRTLRQRSLMCRSCSTTPIVCKNGQSSINTLSRTRMNQGTNYLSLYNFEMRAQNFSKATDSIGPIDKIGTMDVIGRIDAFDGVQAGERMVPADNCQIVSEISRCESSQQLLAHFDKHINSTKDMNVSVLADYLITLHSLAYKELSYLPWLQQHNSIISYIQLVVKKSLTSSMAHITESQRFHKLIDLVTDRVGELTNDELTLLLTHTLWLGVPPTHTVCHAMSDQIYKRVGSMNITELNRVADWNRALTRIDFKIMELAIQHYMELLEKLDSVAIASLSDEAISDICNFVHNFIPLTSNRTREKIVDVVDKWLTVHDTENFSTFGTIGRFYREAYIHVPLNFEVKRKMRDKLYNKCLKVLQDGHVPLRPYHFVDICQPFRSCQIYKAELSNIMQEKSIKILQSETLSIALISNLSSAFTALTPHSIKRVVEDQIYRHLDDADDLILANIGNCLINMECSNADLMTAYQRRVMNSMDSLLDFSSRFLNQNRHILTHDIQDAAMCADFQAVLYKALDGQFGIRMWNVAVLSEYLLPRIHNVIPQHLYNRLLLIIPQCSVFALLRIMNGLNQLKKPWTRDLHNQVWELDTAMHQNIAQKIHNVNSLSSLHEMVNGLYVRSQKKDPGLLDQIINQYPRFTKQMNATDFGKTLVIMSQLYYYHLEILDDLVNFGIDNAESLGMHLFGRLVFLISRVGYFPQRVDEFTSSAVQVFVEQRNDENIAMQVHLALSLAMIQIYPEVIINSIFSVDFIAELDKMIEGHSEPSEVLQRALMMLNRCVVLECPHLDVPWFHEEYCKEQYNSSENNDHVNINRLKEEVQNALSNGLGGEKYFKSRTFSPYYYKIDYECLLNKRGQPVITDLASRSDARELGLQKVAILILRRSSFSHNAKHLSGHEQTKQRHLEILGYKVVHISYYDWNSMALSKWADKVHFIKQKILS